MFENWNMDSCCADLTRVVKLQPTADMKVDDTYHASAVSSVFSVRKIAEFGVNEDFSFNSECDAFVRK